MTRDPLTLKELSELIHKSPRWIRAHLHEMKYFRVGNTLHFRRDEIFEWLEQYREGEGEHPIVKEFLEWYRRILDFDRKSQTAAR
ncbi:helix-turn-helix domain-containing protein [Acidobacteria bacterium AH-259-A15]|nr:helix-turn-helix domain-containing protein [Acidobacteria bacterium AH-259-A15]